MPQAFLRVALLLLAAWSVSACTTLDGLQRRHIFQPTSEIAGTPSDFGFDYVEEWLPVPQAAAGAQPERINAWWMPGPSADACAILYLHGNGWNMGDSTYDTARLRRIGFAVLAIDYRGYGKSEGAFPSESQVYQDAQVGWDRLKQLQPDAARRFVYGHSLGGAIAIDLAARNPDIAGLIVEGSFTSMADMAHEVHGLGYLPIAWLLTQRFDSIAKIGSVKMPVLFVHGESDKVIPHSMSERLHAAAPQPKTLLLVPGAGHSSIAVVAWDRYRAALEGFTGKLGC
ncbi:MAG TPA: alpha/beta fold hydrolase [Albitalea sp.]|nr:alpha/beta fold hydrolase [Albitalea sp.]